MTLLDEAATIKSRARGLLRDAQVLLSDKTLPKAVKDAIEGLRAALRKSWKDLEADAENEEPETEPESDDDDEVQESGNWSHQQIHDLLRGAVDAESGDQRVWHWIRDVYDDWFVYSSDTDSKSYKRSYAIDDEGTVTLGDPTEVVAQTVYVNAAEAAMLESGFVPLVEKSVRKDGTIPIKIIAPGWGSSGYYSPDVLQRDGPKVFTKGLKMYWNHPTPTEEAERPERDLRDLSAILTTDAVYDKQHAAGPGLYADAQVFGPYREAVDELAPHIGVSIRALGRAKAGEADGQQGNIVEEIVAAKSVDFVTTPGAGGQVLQLFEAARRRQSTAGGAVPLKSNSGGNNVTEQEAQELRDRLTALEAENARLREANVFREARELVGQVLGEAGLPEPTRARLLESLSARPVLVEGALDREATRTLVEAAARDELAYLAEVTGSGRITGMGGTQQPTGEEARAKLIESFQRMGLSKEAAEIAAEGR